MASILILSERGDGVPLGLRLAGEGHIIKFWIHQQKAKQLLQGYHNPSQVGDPRKMTDQYDLILSDSPYLGDLCEELGRRKPSLGGGLFHSRLELDAQYHNQVVSSLLQLPSESIDAKVDLVVGGWFSGSDWLSPFSVSWLQRRLMSKECGPLTDCSGSTTWLIGEGAIIEKTFIPLTPLLRKVGFTGLLRISCALGEGGEPTAIQLKASFGYDTMQAWCELLTIPLFNFLYPLASREAKELVCRSEFGLSVRLSVWPYPQTKDMDLWQGVKVLDIPAAAKRHIWLTDVSKPNGYEQLAGLSGVVGCVTARGRNIKECRRRAYRTLQNAVISPEVQYRCDIGEGAEEIYLLTKEWGWI